jgi:hypothetical protein
LLAKGRGYDLFRMSIYEGAALGANMTLPYGSWMGSVIQDAFYAPHELCIEVNRFLAEHDRLFSPRTWNDTAVIYSVESNMQLVARRELFADVRNNLSGDQPIPFWDVCEALIKHKQPYDVIFFPEGQLRKDTLRLDDLKQYKNLVLPDVRYLTTTQAGVLEKYLESGGKLLIIGGLGTNLEEVKQKALLEHPGTTRLPVGGFEPGLLDSGPQVSISTPSNLAINIQRAPEGAAVHIIRYDYDENDGSTDLPYLTLDLRLDGSYRQAEVFSPSGHPKAAITFPSETMAGEGRIHIELTDVPLYTIVVLKD